MDSLKILHAGAQISDRRGRSGKPSIDMQLKRRYTQGPTQCQISLTLI